MNGALSWVADTVMAAPAASPAALSFLIRHYLSSGRLDVREALERCLATSLSTADLETSAVVRTRWTAALSDVSTLTDDDWMVEELRQRVPRDVEALEGFVRRVYEPGDGLVGVDASGHAQCALALLDAFALTGRLPYPMLADELYRTATLRWMAADADVAGDLRLTSMMIGAGCRLALLHATAEYTARAVIAPDADYTRDADRWLALLQPVYQRHPDVAADYGLALLERFALAAHPN